MLLRCDFFRRFVAIGRAQICVTAISKAAPVFKRGENQNIAFAGVNMTCGTVYFGQKPKVGYARHAKQYTRYEVYCMEFRRGKAHSWQVYWKKCRSFFHVLLLLQMLFLPDFCRTKLFRAGQWLGLGLRVGLGFFRHFWRKICFIFHANPFRDAGSTRGLHNT